MDAIWDCKGYISTAEEGDIPILGNISQLFRFFHIPFSQTQSVHFGKYFQGIC